MVIVNRQTKGWWWRSSRGLLIWSLSTLLLANSCEQSQWQPCQEGVQQHACYQPDSLNNPRFYVSEKVYAGWTLFRSYCNACHIESDDSSRRYKDASDRLLVPIIRAVMISETSEQAYRAYFRKTVLQGQVSETSWMPTWKSNPLVSRRIDDIYAYLKIRAQCQLPDISHTRPARLTTDKELLVADIDPLLSP